MSIAEKLVTIAENEQKVYNKGYNEGYAEGDFNGYQSGYENSQNDFWDKFQSGGKRTDYEYAFSGDGWTAENFKPKYNLIGRLPRLIYYAKNLEVDVRAVLKEQGITLDTSKSESLVCFSFNSAITALPTISFVGIDTNDVHAAKWCFGWDKSLHTIEKLIVKEGIFYNETFYQTIALKNIEIEGIIDNNIDFSYSSLLTHKSLMSIINHLKNLSVYSRNLSIGTNNLAKLTDAEKAIATQKGWNLA